MTAVNPINSPISQYANSPTKVRLFANQKEYFDMQAKFQLFYDNVWNVDTAVGYGLDIWGRRVGVARQLNAPGAVPIFGFYQSASPTDYSPFNVAPFSDGSNATSVYTLPDVTYRKLILAKAAYNLSDCSVPSINKLLRSIMDGRKAYVVNNLNMTMDLHFEFVLTPLEYAIITQSGVIPTPAGVTVNIVSL